MINSIIVWKNKKGLLIEFSNDQENFCKEDINHIKHSSHADHMMRIFLICMLLEIIFTNISAEKCEGSNKKVAKVSCPRSICLATHCARIMCLSYDDPNVLLLHCLRNDREYFGSKFFFYRKTMWCKTIKKWVIK